MIWNTKKTKKISSTATMLTATSPPQTSFPYTHPALYTANKCCFHCSLRALKSHASALVESLPPGAWESKVKPVLILPMLRRLSLFDPWRRMPLLWLECAEDVPAQCPGEERVTMRYWHMCKMVWAGPGNDEAFFLTMHSLASSIMHIIINREVHPVSVEGYSALGQQIAVLGGRDAIMNELIEAMNRARRGTHASTQRVATVIHRAAASEYALFLIDGIATTFFEHDVRRRALERVRATIVAALAHEAATHTAVRMALHRRSTGAAIRVLGPDLLLACIRGARRERIVLWEEVLAEWLQPMVTEESERELPRVGGEE